MRKLERISKPTTIDGGSASSTTSAQTRNDPAAAVDCNERCFRGKRSSRICTRKAENERATSSRNLTPGDGGFWPVMGTRSVETKKEARSKAVPPVGESCGPVMNLIGSSLLRAAASLPVANPKSGAGSGSGAQPRFAVWGSFARWPKIVRLRLSPPERWSKTSRR